MKFQNNMCSNQIRKDSILTLLCLVILGFCQGNNIISDVLCLGFSIRLCQRPKPTAPESVVLYSKTDMSGNEYIVKNVSVCTNISAESRYPRSIDTRGNCVKLFDSRDCNGTFIEVMARSPKHNDLGAWHFDKRAQSVGPCRDPCDPEITGNKPLERPSPQFVTIFKGRNYQGEKIDLLINGCTRVPRDFSNFGSIRMERIRCVQFYNNSNCRHDEPFVDSIELRYRTPLHRDISAWNFQNARSASFCNYKCSKIYEENTTPNSGEVIIFDQKEYQGYRLKLLIGNDCVNLSNAWRNAVVSIKIASSHCVTLFSEGDCEGDFRRITSSTSDLSIRRFDNFAQSLRACQTYSQKELTSTLTTKLTQEVYAEERKVILFSRSNFSGNSTTINLKHCVNLASQFENATASIKIPNRSCVLLYERKQCEGNFTFANESIHSLSIQKFPFVAQSIQSCQRQHDALPSKITAIRNKTESSTLPDMQNLSSISSELLVVVVAIPLLGIVLLVLAVICIMQKYRPYKRLIEKIPEKELKEFLNGLELELHGEAEQSKGSDYSANFLAQNRPYDRTVDVPRSKFTFDEKHPLGAGEYGVVYKGSLTTDANGSYFLESSHYSNRKNSSLVAVKTVKSDASIQSLRNLMKEIKVMLYAGKHNHVIQLVGCCTENLQSHAEVFVLLEYCVNGALEPFLMQNRHKFRNYVVQGELDHDELLKSWNVPEQTNTALEDSGTAVLKLDIFQQLQWCLEIAEGMEFLSSKKIIHSDLAARNILLNDKLQTKISDFGLSKQLYSYNQYVKKRQEPLPWRWMALESLRDLEFSTMSDVWGYGILCWEIFTLSEKPYACTVWSPDFVQSIQEGLRPRKPEYALSECYNLMVRCWEENPSNRPDFREIAEEFSDILETARSQLKVTKIYS